jgi:hypothetical protein
MAKVKTNPYSAKAAERRYPDIVRLLNGQLCFYITGPKSGIHGTAHISRDTAYEFVKEVLMRLDLTHHERLQLVTQPALEKFQDATQKDSPTTT